MPALQLGPLDCLVRLPMTLDDTGRLRRLVGRRLPFEWRGHPAGSLVLRNAYGRVGEGIVLRFGEAPQRQEPEVLERIHPLGDFAPYMSPGCN